MPHSTLRARPLLPAATPLPGGASGWLLLTLFLIVGLFRSEPWRGEDARHFGVIFAMLHTHGSLVPALIDEYVVADGPLYYWLASFLAHSLGGLLAEHDAARLASLPLALLALYWLGQAAAVLAGKDMRWPVRLLCMGSLGLVFHVHEIQPQVATLAMLAALYASLSRLAPGPATTGGRPSDAVLWSGLAGAGVVLAAGQAGVLMALPLLALAPGARARERAGMLALAIALPAGWLLAAELALPGYAAFWLRAGFAHLTAAGMPAEPLAVLEMAGWFTWPLWPLVGWGLWQARRQPADAHTRLVRLACLCAVLPLLLRQQAEPERLMVLLPAMALLAQSSFMRLRRGAASAFNWFAGMNFTVFAALVWMAWSAMALDWPPGLARYLARSAPGFAHPHPTLATGAGLALCLLWLGLALRLPRSPIRGIYNWALGIGMLWCLSVLLLMPWFSHHKAMRPAVEAIALARSSVDADCLAGYDLNDSYRAALHYLAGLRTASLDEGPPACRYLLVRARQGLAGTIPASTWQEIWFYQRGGARQRETLRLYHHDSRPLR